MSIFKWSRDRDIPLELLLQNDTGAPLSGLVSPDLPEVAVVRQSDGFFWDGATGFAAPANFVELPEADPTNRPGIYSVVFPNATLDVEETYRAYYQHTATPVGFDQEIHISTNEIFIPSSNPFVQSGAFVSAVYNDSSTLLTMDIWLERSGGVIASPTAFQIDWYHPTTGLVFSENDIVANPPDARGHISVSRTQTLLADVPYYAVVSVTDAVSTVVTHNPAPMVGP